MNAVASSSGFFLNSRRIQWFVNDYWKFNRLLIFEWSKETVTSIEMNKSEKG